MVRHKYEKEWLIHMGKQTKSSQQKASEETQTLDLLANIHKLLILNMFKELKEIYLKN